MESLRVCPECGAVWQDDLTCQEYFHQMLYWEAEDPSLGEVHHLMVLCYHLQHPSYYSPAGLEHAKQLLSDFVEAGLSPQEIRQRDSSKVASQNRKWKIKGTDTSRGFYQNKIKWKIVAKDVVAAGKNNYCQEVRDWAKVTLETLKASGIREGINSIIF